MADDKQPATAGHEPDPQHADHEDNCELTSLRNARYGVWLFLVYLLLYAGFMAVSAFAPGAMNTPVFMGVNLAVCYGFALIGAALVLALMYVYLCRNRVDRADRAEASK